MDAADNNQPVVYRLRRDNSIDWVNDAWVEAAVQLNQVELLPQRVIGQPLDLFIADEPTARHITNLLNIVRVRGDAQLCYRCDTPTHKRIFNTLVSASTAGAVELWHEPMSEIPLSQPYLQQVGITFRKILRCSFCAKLHIDDMWMEPETAIEKGLLNKPHQIQIVHTTCRSCLNEAKKW